MAVGLQVWSQTAANNANADSNINWPEGMAPSQTNDSARAEMASVAKWRDDNNGSIVTSGSSTAYTAATSQIEAALTAGYTVAVQFHATPDSSATLNVDSLGGKPLQIIAGTNLKGGEYRIGSIARFTYSTTGTGQWIANGAEAAVPGVADGSNANAGLVGEYQSSLLTSGSAVTIATSSAANITSISLTAGDWDLYAEAFFKTTSGSVTNAITVISNATAETSATALQIPADGFDFAYRNINSGAPAAGFALSGGALRTRASSASSATYFLNTALNFSSPNVMAYGGMRARRVR
jgi:hypothetical protein